jgi:tryptophan synthase alpha chain
LTLERIDRVFAELRQRGEGAFMPFLVIGDPDPKTSLDLASALIRAGADLLEFGLPFSDPPADGPVIQAAGKRALARGATTDRALEHIREVRRATETPIALLLYYNLILQRGVSEFYRQAAQAGVDAILVADLPIEEADASLDAAERHRIAPIFIVSELTSERRLEAISPRAKAYLYLVARLGVTGERGSVDQGLGGVIARVRRKTRLPLLAGFGLSKPDHVREVIEKGADGAIVGSAIVQRIEQSLGNVTRMIDDVESLARQMKRATRAIEGA